MIKARPQYAGKLDFVEIRDFQELGVFNEAVKGVDGVIHVASVSSTISHSFALGMCYTESSSTAIYL
jgi:hypothetical protein